MKIIGAFEFEIRRNAGIKELLEDIIVAILCHLVWYAPTIAIATYFLVTAPDAGYRAFACIIILAAYIVNHISINNLYSRKWDNE